MIAEDLRIFTHALTRRAFRELPFRFVLIPVLDGPHLCYPDELVGQVECWRAELSDLWLRYRRTRDRDRRIRLTRAMRRLHIACVNAAEGYAWPGAEGRYVVEFAPDPV